MWFRSIFDATNSAATGHSPRSKKRRPQRRCGTARLRLEGLETRSLLAFSGPVGLPIPYYDGANAAAAGDFANNGIQDLVVAGNDGLSVLMNNGNGLFQLTQNYAIAGANATSVAVGDLNGDGKLDIVAGSSDGVSILLGNGDETFQAEQTFDPSVVPPGYSSAYSQSIHSIALGDMNHDGRLDVVAIGTISIYHPFPTYGETTYDYVDVLVGHGDGTLSLASATLLGGNGDPFQQGVALGDFNGDGNLDVATLSGSSVAVLRGHGDGTLAPPTYFATGPEPVSLAVGDVNGDGKLDLVTANYNYFNVYGGAGSVSVLLGNGDGSFQAPDNIALPNAPNAQAPTAVVMGDLNRDGKMDLAVTALSIGPPRYYSYREVYSNVNILLGNGRGGFTNAQVIPAGGASIIAADFNGDGFPDLAVNASVLMNNAHWPPVPTATSFAVSGFPSSTAGTPGSFSVTALNPDGTVDTGYTGTVQFSSSDGQAALPGSYTFIASDAGKHTFSATLKTAGTQSITATDVAFNTLSGSETGITVTAAAASHFAVSAPTRSTAGNSFSITVTALDPYNNNTDYAGTVHFTSSDAKAVLPANYTFTSGDAGKHTFSATLKTAGAQSITATDTVNASLQGTDSSITVNAAAASKFVLSGPSSVMPGQSFGVTVTVEDAYGNIVTGYTGTIHFTSSDNKATLPANYTFTAGNNGVHTFTGLVLKKTGNQTITVTDTKNSSITGKTVVDVV